MSIIEFHPDDVRWLRRWLRGHLVCLAVVGVLLLGLRMANLSPVASTGWIGAAQTDTENAAWPATTIGAESAAQSKPMVAIVPDGWRRTVDGWEHTSSWQRRRIATAEESTEAITQNAEANSENASGIPMSWIDARLQQLDAVGPLGFALFQLIGVACVFHFSQRSRVFPSRKAIASRTEASNPTGTSNPTETSPALPLICEEVSTRCAVAPAVAV